MKSWSINPQILNEATWDTWSCSNHWSNAKSKLLCLFGPDLKCGLLTNKFWNLSIHFSKKFSFKIYLELFQRFEPGNNRVLDVDFFSGSNICTRRTISRTWGIRWGCWALVPFNLKKSLNPQLCPLTSLALDIVRWLRSVDSKEPFSYY